MRERETPHRVERDSMGEVKVPRQALFGAQTRRALDNFPVSDLRFQRRFIQALGAIKLEAAVVNNELGLLDEELEEAIVEAAGEVVEGRLDNQFVLDIFQTGSGTPTTTSTRANPPTTLSRPPYTSPHSSPSTRTCSPACASSRRPSTQRPVSSTVS